MIPWKTKVHEKAYPADLKSKHREASRNRMSVSSRPAWDIYREPIAKDIKGEMNGDSR